MALNVIFLVSSMVTARLLDKKKLRVASVAYAVMFVIMALVLLFTVDAEVIRDMMVRLVGKMCYVKVHFAFVDAIRAPLYGVYMMGAIILTFVVQLAVTAFCTVEVIVCHFSKQNSLFRESKKAHARLVRIVSSLRLSQQIHLLCCRILN